MKHTNGLWFINAGQDGLNRRLFGMSEPACLRESYVRRLSEEWGEYLFFYMHPATAAEINEYGIYDIK